MNEKTSLGELLHEAAIVVDVKRNLVLAGSGEMNIVQAQKVLDAIRADLARTGCKPLRMITNGDDVYCVRPEVFDGTHGAGRTPRHALANCPAVIRALKNRVLHDDVIRNGVTIV